MPVLEHGATVPVVAPVHIDWDRARCSDCMSCVVVCSERHTGTSAPSRARLRILVDLLTGDVTAEYCRQCAAAECAAVCPEEAILFDAATRAWPVDGEKCVACAACVDACPYHAIQLDPLTGMAVKCDLCGGDVRCVEICPTGALSLVEGDACESQEAQHGA